MNCPRCQLPLRTTDYEGVEVDMCESCWGFWLDQGELEEVLERKELKFSEEERQQILAASSAWNEGSSEPAPCPKCNQTMRRHSYDESIHLLIDRCPDHGTWLDTGELKRVQAVAEKSEAIHRLLLKKLGY